MAEYDPFARGPHPVGVRTTDLHDADRDRTVPVEVWYPATAAVAGRDLDPATQDTYAIVAGLPETPQDAVRDAVAHDAAGPAIVFSHGFAGHRRTTTHLCTHLASHGYVVASPDHVGNTTPDVMGWMMSGTPPEDMVGYVTQVADDRPADARLTVDALLAGELGVQPLAGGVGMAGHSFGGWTVLQTTAEDERIVAALPLAPVGGSADDSNDVLETMSRLVDLGWDRSVPTLVIAADDDSVVSLAHVHDLVGRAPSIGQMVVLVDADHFHFCDGTEVVHDLMAPVMGTGSRPAAELIPGAQAHQVTNGLGLAHFDAALRGSDEAAALLALDLGEVLAERGIRIDVVHA